MEEPGKAPLISPLCVSLLKVAQQTVISTHLLFYLHVACLPPLWCLKPQPPFPLAQHGTYALTASFVLGSHILMEPSHAHMEFNMFIFSCQIHSPARRAKRVKRGHVSPQLAYGCPAAFLPNPPLHGEELRDCFSPSALWVNLTGYFCAWP